MIRIALNMDDLWNYILRSIADGVNDHSAADRTIRAGTTCLGGTINLQSLRLCVDGVKTEAKRRDTCRPNDSCFEKRSSRNIHRMTSTCELDALTIPVVHRNRRSSN